MKRVISFNIAQCKRDALLSFFRAVITAANSDEKVTAECSIQLAALVASFDRMQELAERHQMNLLTPEVQAADEWRDANLTRLRAGVRAEQKNPDPAKRQAAELLWKICEELGRVHNQAYDVQTGALTTFCLDLENNHSQEVTLLGLTDAFNALKAANEAFIKILAERTEDEGSYEVGSSQKARTDTINAYRNLVAKINVLVIEGHYNDLAAFIDYLNAEIKRQRISLGQGPASSGDEEDDEDAVRVKTATFKFVDGRKESYPVEVGTVLIAPSNTEGYKWKPAVPEFMPETNKTFREVPIDAEEATATFHFFDHREEEIKQVVGSALTAPENTAGYYWEPEVPSVMPAEDTSYYELPEEQQQEEEEEEEDNRQEYQITYMDANNEDEFDIQMVKEGDPIVPPTPPTGYHWVDVPEVMPARNIYIRCAANA